MATVAIDKMVFVAPIHVGDFICCYAELLKVGRTSMTILVQTFADDVLLGTHRHVTEGIFTYVAIDEDGRPVPVSAE